MRRLNTFAVNGNVSIWVKIFELAEKQYKTLCWQEYATNRGHKAWINFTLLFSNKV